MQAQRDPDDPANEVSEITRNVEAPDAASLVERMLEMVASEAEALLAGDDDGRLADLNVRTALASWDALHATDEAMRFLELADRHPLAPRMRVAAALTAGDADVLAAAETRIGDDTGALAIEIAEAWLWRHGKADRAAAIADRLLAATTLPPAWRAHVVEIAALSHHVLGNWKRVVELRQAALTTTSSPEEVAATAALLLDRTGDARAALTACWAKLEHYPGVGDLEHAELGWLRTFDLAIAAATVLDDERRFEILDKRAELVASFSGGGAEALATRHAVAAELERDREHAQALDMWQQLAEDTAAQSPGIAKRIAYLRAAWAAAGSSNRPAALAAHRRLAGDPACLEVAATHAWRALELAAATNDPSLPELARAVVDTVDSHVAERWLDALDVTPPRTEDTSSGTPKSDAFGGDTSRTTPRGEAPASRNTPFPSAAPGPNAATMVRFEERGRLFVRWAAAIAERRGEPQKAISLWQRAAADPDMLPTTRDHLVRLHRAGDEDALADAYAAAAKAEPDERSAAALWTARGIVDLARGDFVEAEDSLRHAADLGPKDPFARAALAAVYRAGRDYQQLSRVLSELSTSLTSKDARAQAAREHAELLDEHLGNPAGARAALDRLIAERPTDVDAILTLARLCERDQLIPRAIDLRKKAAELAPVAKKGDIFIEIARGEERRGDPAAALAALERAAETKHPDALREQARLHREAGRLDKSLAIVRAELATDPPIGRRMELQKELARTLNELGQEPEGVVAAYLDVLSVEPDQTEALIGIEEPARMLGLWDELARAFRGAPQSPRNLEVLAEALTKIAEWSELAEVRRKQLEAAGTTQEKAQRATELARIYEQELGDAEAAIRMLLIAQAAEPHDTRQGDLLRMLRSAGRWPEVALVLERDLPTIKPNDIDKQVAVLLELGELRGVRLNRQADAIAAYEGVLALRPDEQTAAKALETLYETTGRDRELARILEARAEATKDGAARAALFARVATLRSNRGDVDGSLAAYTAAFAADPTNRDVFTSMERVCYKAERWAAAMQLYESAIAHVESGASRAYRLGDLYSRRGNVQLNFLGQVDAAIASYQKVVEVDSQPAAAVKVLETLCAQRGNWQPLIDAWEKRAETQRDQTRKTEALRNAAQLASEHASDPRASMRLNRRLLSIDPADAAAASTLERYYEDSQDKSGLVDLLKMRLSQAHGKAESVELLKRIARVEEEGARDANAATEQYQKILEIQPDNRDALDALGRIYESTEQWAEFIDVTRKLIKVTNDRNTKALLYFRCGSVMEAKFGREQDAIRYYDAAIKTSSACLPAVHGLRDLYRRREEWPRVIETLELEVKLWQDDKERAGVFAQIGRIHEKQLNDPEKGMTYYESALSVDPECLPANQALFEHYYEAAEWDKAQPLAASLAQKAMREGDPATRSDFYRRRGVVAKHTGDPRAAAESFIVALELKPTNAEALDELGRLARERPDAWEFEITYRELDKLYRRRDDAGALLARVHIGRAAIIEREGDLDQAATLYAEAIELAPSDFTVLSAVVDFHWDVRHWSEAITAIQRFVNTNATSSVDRLRARMRQAGIHADGEMEPQRAINVLRDVIKSEPSHQDAYYMLAQQYFLVAKYPDARTAIDRVIELATAPGQPLSPPALARYYYYKGRILDAAGDSRAAAPQYRRASEYDPGYAPPALVLARRAAEGGDQRQAETLLIEAAHAAMAQGGPRAAVPLQRGLARILLNSGDRPAAIEAYRGILNVEPDSPSDRVALAEIYAIDDAKRAIVELRKVLERDIHHAPAYRLLAGYYNRSGDVERANRVLTALDLLGFAEEADRSTAQRLRANRVPETMRRQISEDSRERLLLTAAAREPLGDVFAVFAEELSSLVAQPTLGENLLPASGTEPRVVQLAAELAFLYDTDAEVFIGEKVPGLFAVTAYPRRLVVIDRTLLAESDATLRYMFGYAFEAIRGGYAALLQLGARHRRELGALMRALLAADAELTGPAADLVNTSRPEAQKVLEQHAGIRDVDAGAWMDGMVACAKRAGLLACDDFSAAIWAVARLSGERLPSHDATVALGAVLGGPDLVRFYLSDDYQALRDALTVG